MFSTGALQLGKRWGSQGTTLATSVVHPQSQGSPKPDQCLTALSQQTGARLSPQDTCPGTLAVLTGDAGDAASARGDRAPGAPSALGPRSVPALPTPEQTPG